MFEYIEFEHAYLSELATKSDQTKGRQREMEPCEYRTEFQRDRDRILHCKSFRRLKYKTQVFLSPFGDHYRTRMTHTLEVSQIARTIARALRLNEDLVEAISLGHDLGHTPFGHAGERVLQSITGDFSHNQQSLRIVDFLEDGKGLNLTFEVRDGIANHRTSGNPCTLEGKVVQLSDKIAYINHDVDDAIRAGLFTIEDLPKDAIALLGERHGQRINTMVDDVVKNCKGKDFIKMTEPIWEATNQLRKYLFKEMYSEDVESKEEEKKAAYVIEILFRYFEQKPEKLPEECIYNATKWGIQKVICDFIAGMTDRYAINLFEQIYVPKAWK